MTVKKHTKPKKFPRVYPPTQLPDGGTKVVTDDGIYTRTRTEYRVVGVGGAFDAEAARKAVEFVNRGREREMPSAKATLRSVKAMLIEGFGFGVKPRKGRTSAEKLLFSDAQEIFNRIEVAEFYMESGQWDRAGAEIYEIGVSIAQLESQEALGEVIQKSRIDSERKKMGRKIRNRELREFLGLKADGLRMERQDALKFMVDHYEGLPEWEKLGLKAPYRPDPNGNWDRNFLDAFDRHKKASASGTE